jgi:DNA modification methylase
MNYEILQGDALQTLKTLPANSVQCCVTSPPYLNLRSYLPDNHPDKAKEIGFAQTPEEYVAKLVDVFCEVRRALRDDGTLWLNLAASYNGSGGAGGDYNEGGLKDGQPKFKGSKATNYKPKDMIPVPWLAAIALQQDGWWLRADIIWHKLSPMPASYTDRPTVAHEYVFLLTKSAQYYYDADAIREPHKREWWNDGSQTHYHNGTAQQQKAWVAAGKSPGTHSFNGNALNTNGANKKSVWTLGPENSGVEHYAPMPTKLVEPCILAGSKPGDTVLDPFCGSGTTLAVALKHGRCGLGIELNEDYISLAHKRIGKTRPMLLEVTA